MPSDSQQPNVAPEELLQPPIPDQEVEQKSGEGDRPLELVNSEPPAEEELVRKPFVFQENPEPDEEDGDRTPKNTNTPAR